MRTVVTTPRVPSLLATLAPSLVFSALTLAAGAAFSAQPATSSATASAPAATPAQPAAVSQTTPVPLITEEQLLAREARHDPGLVVLDVRTPKEFAEGHVPGAVNISHEQVESRLAEIPRDKDVVLYCHSGRRAGIAADVLKSHGYTRLYHLEGDMIGWVDRKQPLEK